MTARGKKKKSKILLEIERMRRALQETGKEKQFSLACTAAMLLMIAGFIVAIAIDNMFLIPVLAVAFALIPFAYLAKTISIYETQVREEIETALSIITTSYVRSDNLISAVKENSPSESLCSKLMRGGIPQELLRKFEKKERVFL